MRKYFDPYLDLRAIGMFRIMLAAVLILDLLINKWPNLTAFYTEEGVLNSTVMDSIIANTPDRGIYRFGLLEFFDSRQSVGLFFIFTILSYLCLLIGYRTRLTSVLAFAFLWSIHQRNSFVLSGPDELLINLLFIAMFLPLDQRYSFFTVGEKGSDSQYRGVPAFYTLFFIGLVYFFQAFLKDGHVWENGDAISYALMENLWTNNSAGWLLDQEQLCQFLSSSTLWIEYSIPVLLFLPVVQKWSRMLAIVLLLGLHWTIFIFLDLGLFPILVPTFVVLLLPSEFIDWLVKKLRGRISFSRTPQLLKAWYNPKWKTFVIAPFLIVFGILVLWQSALRSPTLQASLPQPNVLKKLENTSLLFQYWGFYAPNPSIVHGWFKVVGVRPDGSRVDLKSNLPLSNTEQGLEHYKGNYSWNVLYYKTLLYRYVSSRELLNAWAKYEYTNHAHEGYVRVELVTYTKKILAPKQETPLTYATFAYFPY